MHQMTLTPEDNALLGPMLADLAKTYDTIENPELIRRAPVLNRALPPHVLELEITESTAMQQTDMALRTLKRLKQIGVWIAIDDLGTRY